MAQAIVLFIGSNPSCKSLTGSAFDEKTRSGKTLHEWMHKANIDTYLLDNIFHHATPGNRALTAEEKRSSRLYIARLCKNSVVTHVVALGKEATKELSAMNIEFLDMPHPSGLNRKLNDAVYVEEQMQRLRDYVSKPR